jgi:phosphate transport system permease protein
MTTDMRALPPPTMLDLGGSPGRRRTERTVRAVLFAAALVSVLISAFIVLSIIEEAVSFLAQIDPAQLTAEGWFPRRGLFGISTLIVGSILVTGIAIVIAAPIGIASAIYLAEYSGPRTRGIVKPILEILAGIPSIVLGFFALTVITPDIIQAIWPDANGFNLLAAGIGVGILTIPLIATISEDAMRAVPRALREGAYGLGARRATVSLRIVVPAAISGIVAALILGISRSLGETMVVALAAGASGGTLFTTDVLGPGQTVTAAMAALATGSDQVTGNTAAFQSLFFLGLMLFLATLGLNVIGDTFVRRTRQRY